MRRNIFIPQPFKALSTDLRSAEHFDFNILRAVCEVPEQEFHLVAPGIERVEVDQRGPSNYYYFKDNGAKILAVAHLDTCVLPDERKTVLAETAGGDVVYSGALDDRLGAYVILDLLPKMGIEVDWLFTVGEEDGQSTASFFEPSEHHDREYNWIIEFDRGGTDVVLYQYDCEDLRGKVEETGRRVGDGAFSDISFMEHVGRKAMNWGVGYRDYHTTRGHVWLTDLFLMVDAFVAFHAEYKDEVMPHESMNQWGTATSPFLPDAEGDEECDAWSWSGEIECSGERKSTPFGDVCEAHLRWIESD